MDVEPLDARQRGITLVELAVSLVVATTLLAIAVPQWQTVTQRSGIDAARSELFRALSFARISAVNGNVRVAICATLDASSCSRDNLAWHKGYMIFVDQDQDRERDQEEPILRLIKPADVGLLIQTSRGNRVMWFKGDGGFLLNVTFRVCSQQHPKHNGAVIVNYSGRIRMSDQNDNPITCEG